MSFLGFENGFGAWKNALYEAYDFNLHQGPTSSAFTGPSTDARGDKKGRGEISGGTFWKQISFVKMLSNNLSAIFFWENSGLSVCIKLSCLHLFKVFLHKIL